MEIVWREITNLTPKKYVCGFCSHKVSSDKGWSGRIHQYQTTINANIYLCSECDYPTFFCESIQIPGVKFGSNVNYIPDKTIESIYEEARNCFSHQAYTATAMCCRKLLMNIAVREGAAENLSFQNYVDYLLKNSLPPKANDWVDLIRQKGNDANHQIEIINKVDAEHLIRFSEMLLKTIYEFPGIANQLQTTSKKS